MAFVNARINALERIVNRYDGGVPLHRFLSEFYRSNKQMGGRDRKETSRLVYNYFRFGKALPQLPLTERLSVGSFLCEQKPDSLLNELIMLNPLLPIDTIKSSLAEKLVIIEKLYADFSLATIFPFEALLSKEFLCDAFLKSHLEQPKLWIRVRNKYLKDVLDELTENNIIHDIDTEIPNCIAFQNGTKLEELNSFKNGYFEIQDRSSQLTGQFFKTHKNQYWWDCCAASGGKSLMLLDIEPTINLTVSDIRPSIIDNLKERFKRVGVKNFSALVANLINEIPESLVNKKFDRIIADVPCTGSGTWGRTPENISFFNTDEIKRYSELQYNIAANAIKCLKPDGELIYITCSVFEQENMNVVERLVKEKGLVLMEARHIAGYEVAADTMFAARLKKI